MSFLLFGGVFFFGVGVGGGTFLSFAGNSGSPYLGNYGTAAARAALPILISVCSVFVVAAIVWDF